MDISVIEKGLTLFKNAYICKEILMEWLIVTVLTLIKIIIWLDTDTDPEKQTQKIWRDMKYMNYNITTLCITHNSTEYCCYCMLNLQMYYEQYICDCYYFINI